MLLFGSKQFTAMRNPLYFLLPLSISLLSSLPYSSSFHQSLSRGSSLLVSNPDDFLASPNRVFTAGFYRVGQNAYHFAVLFSNQTCTTGCVIWIANRDHTSVLVNGMNSRLTLRKNGNLILTDAGYNVAWSSDTDSGSSSVQLQLTDAGNLILARSDGEILWQSFDFPTNTLVAGQKLTRNTFLVSSRSLGNFSAGYYKLYFDNDNILRLLYNGPDISSVYWPDPWLVSMQTGRTTFNDSRVAVFDSMGNFTSSDGLEFLATDFGDKVQRRLTVDYDGNVRLYSLPEKGGQWIVSWQAISKPCTIHGICGPNSMCSANPKSGRSCSCAPGYVRINLTDWTQGCKPAFGSFCGDNGEQIETAFLRMTQSDFYGYDEKLYENYTLKQCEETCLRICNCKGFQYSFNEGSGQYKCYPKVLLLNGFVVPSGYGTGTIYLRLPKTILSSYGTTAAESSELECWASPVQVLRTYLARHPNRLLLKMLLIFAGSIAGVEIMAILLVWCLVIRTHKGNGGASVTETYQLITSTGFRRYTYAELKKATRNFRQEIGRGAAGSVYRAVLPGGRIAAVKRLREASQAEDEFLAEVSTIGKLNHMNLIEMLGYCADGNHRLLVYEHMEHGSLAENLTGGKLDWRKRFDIAIGAARGLAYLHEECLEWVLHCDVKPHNILLDSEYRPKVADFGLSKLLNRSDQKISGFSRIRGTRGYMAPEWVYNLPITSKVDVYSYGIVLLEMLTGRGPTGATSHSAGGEGETEIRTLTSWVRDKMERVTPMATWIEKPIHDELDVKRVEVLLTLALQCVAEDRDVRPTMSQVVEMLQRFEN